MTSSTICPGSPDISTLFGVTIAFSKVSKAMLALPPVIESVLKLSLKSVSVSQSIISDSL